MGFDDPGMDVEDQNARRQWTAARAREYAARTGDRDVTGWWTEEMDGSTLLSQWGAARHVDRLYHIVRGTSRADYYLVFAKTPGQEPCAEWEHHTEGRGWELVEAIAYCERDASEIWKEQREREFHA